MKSLAGTPETWPTRLVVISGALLGAVALQLAVGVAAGFEQPIGVVTATEAGASEALHSRFVLANQWAAPLASILLIGAVVLASHMIGTTEAADGPQLSGQTTRLCRACAVIAALTLAAAIVGVVSDISRPAFPAGTISIQFPSLAQHIVGVLFAAVAEWLALGSIAELHRHRHRSTTRAHTWLRACGMSRSIASHPPSLFRRSISTWCPPRTPNNRFAISR
jgi:NADH:ubiquinone oxidoreductase subunit 6 (subunit J)